MHEKMKELLKNYFIPHEGNDLRPRFFHWETAVIVFSTALFLEILFLIQVFWILPAVNYSANILPGVVVSLTNQNRSGGGLPTLKSNELLAKAAQIKAEDMARKGYFSHESPGGETPWDWLDRVGYDFVNAGENLAVNFADSEDVVSAWMRSQSHKANIMNGKFTEVGIGIARGVFDGRDAIFVVQFFGRPAGTSVAPSGQFTPPTASAGKNVKAPTQAPIAPESEKTNGARTAGENLSKTEPLAINVPSSLAFLKQFFSLPHRMVNYLYIMMLTMIALAFSLMVFIRIHIQHPRLILNGAMMLLLVGSLLVFNHYFLLSQIKVL